MTAENKDFFEALSMLEHERGITAEYLIEKIKAAIIIAVKKNYEVEEDHIRVDIDPDTGRFDVALIQDIVADEDWYDEHAEIGVTEARKIRSSYEVGDRIITPLKTRDFGRIAAQTAKHVIRQGIREAERNQQLSEIQSRMAQCLQPIRAERIRARRTPDPAYDAFFFGLHGQGQTFHLEAFGESGERTAVEGQLDGARGRPLHVMRL